MPGMLGSILQHGPQPEGEDTHTGVLLNTLQDVLGRNQEVNEVAQAVPTVGLLHHIKDLAQDRRCRDLKGRVQCRQGALDAAVQGLGILPREGGGDATQKQLGGGVPAWSLGTTRQAMQCHRLAKVQRKGPYPVRVPAEATTATATSTSPARLLRCVKEALT